MKHQNISDFQDQTPQTIKTERGVSLLWKANHLYSKYNPKKRADSIAKSYCITPKTLYIIPSPLLFYGINNLVNRIDNKSIILLLEKEEKLYQFSLNIMSHWLLDNKESQALANDKRLIFFSLDNQSIFTQIQSLQQKNCFRRVSLVSLNGGYRLHKSFYDSIITFTTKSIVHFWQNISTINQLAPLWYRNIFRNLEQLSNQSPISIPTADQQIAVIGAGESCEKVLLQVKQNRSRYFVIAVDTIIPTLIESEIIPDCCVALEAQHYNLKDFLTIQESLKEIHLLCDISSSPAITRLFQKKTFFITSFSDNQLFNRLIEKFPSIIRLPQLGSVGISALYIALLLKNESSYQDSIFCAGLDFCWIRGKTHAKGTYYHKINLASSNKLKPILDPFRFIKKEIPFPSSSDKPFLSSDALLNYLQSCIDLQQMTDIILSGPSYFFKSSITSTIQSIPFKLWKQQLDSKIQGNHSYSINSDYILSFLKKESNQLEKLLKTTTGIEDFVQKNSFLDYLEDTILVKSSDIMDNRFAGAIKMRANRYYDLIEHLLNREKQL